MAEPILNLTFGKFGHGKQARSRASSSFWPRRIAAEKVAEARKRKKRRLKQAKEEAQVEIEKFKAERERAFKDNEAKNVSSKEDIAIKIEADTKVKIEAMNRSKFI